MKITKSQLKQIIKEEIHKTLRESSIDPHAQQLTADLADVLGIEYENLVAGLEKMVAAETDKLRPEVSVQPDPDDSMDDDDYEMPMMEKKRTAKGNITQDTREKHATVGKDKFPIFDKKSAEAAIDLRGHAPEADRAKIINKAAKYAPEAAKKAREADKE